MNELGLGLGVWVKARGGSRGKKCPLLIFQFVVELE